MESQLPVQSIILPIRNEENFIETTISYILNQDYPYDKFEVIVVDGESSDTTEFIVQRMAVQDKRIKLFRNCKRLSSAARNIGIQMASGEIITFIDGHTYIDNKSLLKNIAILMKSREVSVLSRPQFLDTPENTPFQTAVSLARKSPFGHGLDSTIYSNEEKYVDPTSSGASYTKSAIEKIGLFDENLDAAEDLDFNYRAHQAGFQSFTSMKLGVYYYPRGDLKSLFYQMKRYGIGRFRMALKHRLWKSSGTVFPFLFVAGLPTLMILAIFFPLFRIILIGGYGAYAIMNLASSLLISFKKGLSYFKYLPAIYFTIHWGLGWGFAVELIRHLLHGRQPKLNPVTADYRKTSIGIGKGKAL